MRTHYVYVYLCKGKPIYVGIGNNEDGQYGRARNISAHPEVSKFERKRDTPIEIDVVAQGLARTAALRLEAVLITEYARHFSLLNKNKVDSAFSTTTTRIRVEASTGRWKPTNPKKESDTEAALERQRRYNRSDAGRKTVRDYQSKLSPAYKSLNVRLSQTRGALKKKPNDKKLLERLRVLTAHREEMKINGTWKEKK